MAGPRIKGQTTRVRSFSAFVRAADPDFDLDRRKEPAWEFEGGRVKRTFHQNIHKFGPYIPTAPHNNVAPVVSGDLLVGSILSCTTGTWHGTAPIDYAYQWLLDDVPAEGNGDNYTLLVADIGATVHCVVTASNGTGSASAASNEIGPVYMPMPPANIDDPVITGTPTVGQTLSVTDGTWTQDPTDFSYQWIREP